MEGHARPDRPAVQLGLLETKVEPVLPVPQLISIEGVVPPVPVEEAAELRVDVEIAVAVPVDERHAVSLAEVSRPGVARDVLEPPPLDVPVELLRLDAAQLGVARAEVEVDEAVVVEVG